MTARINLPLALALFFGAVIADRPVQGAITVDGNLSDWGVGTIIDDTNGAAALNTNWGSANVIPNGSFGTRIIGGVTYYTFIEDNYDNLNNDGDALGPNAGGQNYDAEFLGVGVNGSDLVIAIATGQRPDNGLARFSPGDIRIGTSSGFFGVEVGGGAGGGAGGAITEGANGTFYTLNGSGFTLTDGSGVQNSAVYQAGSVWKTPNASHWVNDPIAPNDPAQLSFTPGAQLMGLADYIYTRNSTTETNTLQHAIIEVRIPFALLLNAAVQSVSWSPSCGNDVVLILFPSNGLDTPVPATLPLFALGFAGIAGTRAFRKRYTV